MARETMVVLKTFDTRKIIHVFWDIKHYTLQPHVKVIYCISNFGTISLTKKRLNTYKDCHLKRQSLFSKNLLKTYKFTKNSKFAS